MDLLSLLSAFWMLSLVSCVYAWKIPTASPLLFFLLSFLPFCRPILSSFLSSSCFLSFPLPSFIPQHAHHVFNYSGLDYMLKMQHWRANGYILSKGNLLLSCLRCCKVSRSFAFVYVNSEAVVLLWRCHMCVVRSNRGRRWVSLLWLSLWLPLSTHTLTEFYH